MNYPKASRWSKRVAGAILCGLFFSSTPYAQVIFERETIRIDPMLAEQADDRSPVEVRQSLTYDVEVRAEASAKFEYIHSLNMLTNTTGVLITFLAPTMAGLPAFHNYSAVDVVFIAEDGSILQINPNIVLADITEEILAKDPIKGLLFLKAGETSAHGIRPHDIVIGSMFSVAQATRQ